PTIRVLMFACGIAHDYESLPEQLARALNQKEGLDVRISTDLADVNKKVLSDYDVILFNTCIKSGLKESQRQALLKAVRKGKGLIAVHCALWCFQDWSEWRKIIGGILLKHDPYRSYDVIVIDRDHPIAKDLPARFTVTDEPYLVSERNPDMRVIVETADKHGPDKIIEPQAWTIRYFGGRVFTTTFGHDEKVQTIPTFIKLLSNGIQWAAGRLGPATLPGRKELQEGFKPLFDGKVLKGWRYDRRFWKVNNGIIIGNTQPQGAEKHTFAITERSFGDFILRLSVKVVSGNSGIQFRSQELSDFDVAGYQADAALSGGWGNLHDLHGRGKLVDGWQGKSEKVVNLNDWNEMEVEARGRHIKIKVNSLITADWIETDPDRSKTGVIALQLHSGKPMEVQFTNIRIKELVDTKKAAK
ncbi:MAG: ThuA domain-containing protein, partial [Planctomycetota bacterium]